MLSEHVILYICKCSISYGLDQKCCFLVTTQLLKCNLSLHNFSNQEFFSDTCCFKYFAQKESRLFSFFTFGQFLSTKTSFKLFVRFKCDTPITLHDWKVAIIVTKLDNKTLAVGTQKYLMKIYQMKRYLKVILENRKVEFVLNLFLCKMSI